MKYINNISKPFKKYGIKLFSIFILSIRRKVVLRKLKKRVINNDIFYNELNNIDLDSIKSLLSTMPNLPFSKNIGIIKEKSLFPKQVEEILLEADRFVKNEFKIFESNWIKWEKNGKIDWHTDKISGFTWDKKTYYTDIKSKISFLIKNENKENIDVKVPRELSRFHFLSGLFFAYIYTDEQKYFRKIVDSISSWIDENPPYYGANWSCTMEVAIRITNWCLVLFALKDEILEDAIFSNKFIKSLWEHLIFIMKNLENILPTRNNHYLSDIAGFYIANALFPIFRKSRNWLEWSAKELKKEILRQIYEDGGDFESTTAYQRLVTELFFLPFYLAKHLHFQHFDNEYERRLKKMFIFILNILKPSGKIIQFGDNDSGRLFKLYSRPSLEQGYLLSIGYGMFQDKQFCISEIPFDILSFLFEGEECFNKYKANERSIYNLSSKGFKESGIYVLRNRNFYLAVSCMPNGQNGRGVHTHNDKLSFELSYKDIDIVVDPGTYVYTTFTTERNKFRSTSYHNTVQENGFEQNDFGDNVFEMANDAVVSVNKFSNTLLDCQHNGFVKKGGSIHRRKFMLFDNYFVIEDHLESKYKLKAFLHFAPRIEIIINHQPSTINHQSNNDKIFLIKIDGKSLLKLVVDNFVESSIIDYDYSPGYGELLKGKKLIINFEKKLRMSFFKEY